MREAILTENTDEIYSCIYDVDEAGESAAFFHATELSSFISVQRFLEAGVPVRPDYLLRAVQMRCLGVVNMLLPKLSAPAINIHHKGSICLVSAVKKGLFEIVRRLVQVPGIDLEYTQKWKKQNHTAFSIAIAGRNFQNSRASRCEDNR